MSRRAAGAAIAAPIPERAPAATAMSVRRKRGARGEKHEDRRIEILRTAAELFASNGYEATSLDAIADRLGMHKATLYHYIPNKETILYQCLLASFADLDEVIARMREREVPVIERIRIFVRRLALAQNSVFGRCLVLVGDRPLDLVPGGEVRKFQRLLESTMRELVIEGQADGTIRPLRPGLITAMLFGALNWVPRWYHADGSLSVEQIADAFVDMLIDGVALERTAASPAAPELAAADASAGRPAKPAPKPAPKPLTKRASPANRGRKTRSLRDR